MSCVVRDGQVAADLILSALGFGDAVLEAEVAIAGLDDMTMMGKAVDHVRSRNRVIRLSSFEENTRNPKAFLRSSGAMAKRHGREHEWPAPAAPPAGHRHRQHNGPKRQYIGALNVALRVELTGFGSAPPASLTTPRRALPPSGRTSRVFPGVQAHPHRSCRKRSCQAPPRSRAATARRAVLSARNGTPRGRSPL